MTEQKSSKNNRILALYVSLCEGKAVNKSQEASRFGVDERTIQRDIDDIRAFLDEQRTGDLADNRMIEYDRMKKGFVMTGEEGSLMSNSEILAVSKILLASRAFTKKEIGSILKKMIGGCVPLKNMQLVKELLSNERFHYVELHHKSCIQDKLWELGADIQEHNLIEITYARAEHTDETITRMVEPMAVLFSEYYFYLNAFIVEKDADGTYKHKYSYPAIFRIDRIKAYRKMGAKFRVSYADRFEEGEFRKRIQFMYAGELMKIQLKFYGENPEPVLDRLPTARVIGEKEHEYTISAEVYGKGIVMWLLSQGNKIEVLRPESLRQEMKQKAEEIVKLYS
ncbi:MAG: WYL domain-containing protein [Eubacterium sp.]|nr:WYL domain-containing protein [Eubacterium sp.]